MSSHRSRSLNSKAPLLQDYQGMFMKFWYSTDHDNHYVGVAPVVAAEDEQLARQLLNPELKKRGLDPDKGFTLHELKPGEAKVLQDGDY